MNRTDYKQWTIIFRRFSILLLIKLTNKGGRSYKESWKASLRWAEHVVEEVGSSRQAFKQ